MTKLKKLLIAVLAILATSCCALCFAACGKDKHKHSYTDSIVAPTCTNMGYTLHTCDCGITYTDTFVNAKGHTYGGEVATATYLKSEADCTNKAVYYKSCSVCGEKCEDTFEYGEANGHDFTAQTATLQYFKSNATCTDKAVYYKSCSVCGEKGEDTFEYGEASGHDFTAQTVTVQLFKSNAAWTDNGV